MNIVNQLAIFLENQTGALFRVIKDLAEKKINILAISVSDAVDHAVVRLIVDKPNEAIHMLGDVGVLVVENKLIQLDVANKPGALANLCQLLVDVKMNIEYAYGSVDSKGQSCVLYLRVMEPERVLEYLKDKKL